MREKVGKSRNTVFFQWFGAPEGRKVGQMRDEKVHAVVARSTFPSQNAQNTRVSDHFWKLRCRKSACRCGAKHILKSKCTKHTILGPLLEVEMWQRACRCGAKHISKSKCTKHLSVGRLLEVEMSKKCTPLWREAHFEVKMYKTPHVRATFGGSDVEKVNAAVARSTFRSQNVQNTTCSRHFWRFGCGKSARCCGAKHPTTAQLHSTTLHCAKLHCTTLHDTTLHSTTLHYTTLHYLPLHYTTFHYTSLHYTTLQLQLQLHSATLPDTNLRAFTQRG